MIASVITVVAATMTPQQIDEFCYGLADFSVAVVEAREAGAPLDKVLKHVETLGDHTGTLRNQALKVYSYPSVGGRITRAERQRAINEIAAKCIIDLTEKRAVSE